MTILVTGGAGYIGGHMVLALLDAGQQPVILDNLSTGFRWNVPDGAKLIVGDFGDEALVSRIIAEHKIKAIAHFAAKIVVPESVADPLGYYLNNTVKARSLIDCAVQGGVKHFIFSSTASVYGDQGLEPVAEDAPFKPESPYGRSKLMVEWMLEDTARAHDFSYVALRYFNVAGGDPRGRMGQSTPGSTHLIKRAVQVALGQRPSLQIFGTDYPTPDGTCVRDYVQITDLINAHLLALDYLRAGGKSVVCNCGYGRGLSVRDVVSAVKRVSGIDFETIIAPRRPGDPAAYVAANDRIKAMLGWRAEHDDLDEIVAQALNWERRLHNRQSAES
ncbi:UDP-glucose 4-epimerase GalE [Methylovirgula sp. 4M-Z18]|uniref:UDP-glucose 4-epimerase GalE n=1 Tax=Methylovirgula sp. 4M-Z18 TaxID=2293567 RepID=UPI000E2FAE6F|nr:UDP-glucose 4-epimerase GalE [Methylovirgula sp. 4M-Z18]RFB78709.1 UDP-glucose 4-epimerase GalE [Methylovirgula sp. 4M-Z18]